MLSRVKLTDGVVFLLLGYIGGKFILCREIPASVIHLPVLLALIVGKKLV